MKRRSRELRKLKDLLVKLCSMGAALTGIVFLFWILSEVAIRGGSALNWALVTETPPPPGGTGGGVAPAILGTVYMMALGALLGVPPGLLTGVYLSEFARGNRFGAIVRFMINMMMGVPSIIMGLFVYAVLVLTLGHFSGYAGGVALALLILPIVARTTEDMLALVPNTLRESALALGAARWRVTIGVVFRSAQSGLLTGVLLAVARVSGETAPLLFTSLNSPYWPQSLNQPTANLTTTIFNFAMSPYHSWQATAWGASLLITAAVLLVTILTRLMLQGSKR
ncbi:MAG: phosphate ABC transporter permease PstA [Candidatus Lambdaproteobacteria bacterium]|nr:phosphate ABC transporter permease PstA [Candidatus Lambdaproteobacteria bacterium]